MDETAEMEDGRDRLLVTNDNAEQGLILLRAHIWCVTRQDR